MEQMTQAGMAPKVTFSTVSGEKEAAKRAIDEACALAASVDKEETSLTMEYIDALDDLYKDILTGKHEEKKTTLSQIIIGSNKLIAENLALRHRLKEAISMYVTQALQSGRISLCGR